jgi:hypothetical protein
MAIYLTPIFSDNKENIISYKCIPNCLIHCCISKEKIYAIMNLLLVEYCCVNVYGYNKSNDKYWGKKIKNQICELYFEISVKNNGENNSTISIVPNIGTDKNIKFIYKIIVDAINLHEKNNLLQN